MRERILKMLVVSFAVMGFRQLDAQRTRPCRLARFLLRETRLANKNLLPQ